MRSLDEFEVPAFVGRMAMVERRRRLVWLAMIFAVVSGGFAIGLMAF